MTAERCPGCADMTDIPMRCTFCGRPPGYRPDERPAAQGEPEETCGVCGIGGTRFCRDAVACIDRVRIAYMAERRDLSDEIDSPTGATP